MLNEEDPDLEEPRENGESTNVTAQETLDNSISQKYRELKSKLKYLVYVSVANQEC